MTSVEQTAKLLNTVLVDLATLLERVPDDQLDLPTPCSEFDVAALRDHVVGWLVTFAAGYADPEGNAPRASLDGFTPSGDPATEVRSAATTIDRAIRAGAADRPLRLGGAAMPGDMALSMLLWEYQVHGWDLATATGQPWAPPPEAADASLAFAPAMLTEDYQGDGKPFAPAVPVPQDAPPLDRLVALSGRAPTWPTA